MHTATEPGEVLHFGEFQLDLKNQELRRGGQAVKLPPQPIGVLALLAGRAGELVRREDLERHIWGDDTVVDFRQGLNSCILQLREALGDSARAPQFIETVPRRGYKFIAPVRRELAAREQGMAGSAPALPQGRSLRLPAVAAVAAVVLLTAAFVGGGHPVPQAEAAGNRVMVAVLPFEDLGGREAVGAFADGLTDEVIALLGRPYPEEVGVIARTTAMQYKGSDKDIRQIGRELDVAYVIEGSVRREGSGARITAQLVRVSDQAYLWCDSYDRDLAQPLEVQKEVGRLVAGTTGLFLRHAAPESSLARLQ
jgi:TolB-like protein/DNA-binding winged helix-turn-helix (wHTH) protein